MQKAFENLTEKLTIPPVLPFTDFYSPFVVETDTSSVPLVFVLSQKKGDGKIHPVQFASLTMMEQEGRYLASEWEGLTVLFALKKFREYMLSENPFSVYTDHQVLQTASKKKEIHGSLARWLELMAEYDFEIKYGL